MKEYATLEEAEADLEALFDSLKLKDEPSIRLIMDRLKPTGLNQVHRAALILDFLSRRYVTYVSGSSEFLKVLRNA